MVKVQVTVNEEAKISCMSGRLENGVLVDRKRCIVELCKLCRKTNDQKFSFGWVEG